ncbi:MAG: hypothetical protein RIM84_05000 [Alphaproteobacteria bacterium]
MADEPDKEREIEKINESLSNPKQKIPDPEPVVDKGMRKPAPRRP